MNEPNDSWDFVRYLKTKCPYCELCLSIISRSSNLRLYVKKDGTKNYYQIICATCGAASLIQSSLENAIDNLLKDCLKKYEETIKRYNITSTDC